MGRPAHLRLSSIGRLSRWSRSERIPGHDISEGLPLLGVEQEPDDEGNAERASYPVAGLHADVSQPVKHVPGGRMSHTDHARNPFRRVPLGLFMSIQNATNHLRRGSLVSSNTVPERTENGGRHLAHLDTPGRVRIG